MPADPRPKLDVGPPFRRLNAGWLALDFVNTVPGWSAGAGARGDGRAWRDRIAGERLTAYGDLVRWSRLQGVIDGRCARALEGNAAQAPDEAAAVVGRAHRLRVALYRLFRSAAEEWEPLEEDLLLLNDESNRLRRGEVLVGSARSYIVEWVGPGGDLQALLWPPLRSALALLTDAELLARVGQCDGAGCGWLFLDIGRGRARRWCDSRDCGNVAKVRAFRRRRGAQPG